MSVAIGERLSSLRKNSGLTQKDLFEFTGIDIVTISKYENGGQEPGTENLKKLVQALNTTADYILFGKGEKVSSYYKRNTQSLGYKIAFALVDLYEEGLIKAESEDLFFINNKHGSHKFLWNYKTITEDIDKDEKGYAVFLDTKIKKFAEEIDKKEKKKILSNTP